MPRTKPRPPVAEWAEPPALEDVPTSNHGELLAFVAELRTRPNEWARYRIPYTTASNAYGNKRKYPGTDWRPVRRRDGRFDVYGRWVGEAA